MILTESEAVYLWQDCSNIFILFVVGYFSAKALRRFGFPASRLVGPILGIAILKVAGIEIYGPVYLRIIFSLILGVFLGLRFTKQTVQQLKTALVPALFTVCWYVAITFVYGYLLSGATIMNKATAFLAVVPGGIAEVSLIALSYDADLAQITSFQLARLLTIVLVVPLLAKKLFVPTEESENNFVVNNNEIDDSNSVMARGNVARWLLTIIIGGVGSAIFGWLNVPAGILVGATIAVALGNVWGKTNMTSPPEVMYNLAQMGMGGLIGTSFSRDSLVQITALVGPISIMTLAIILNSMLLAWIFTKIFRWQFITSFLAILPGGLMPMMLIADDVKADVVLVSTLQLVRFLTAIIIIPLFYTIIF